MIRMLLLAALLVAAAPAAADVSVTTQTSGKASFINVGGEGVTQFKGKRQRTDSSVGSKTVSLIIDIDNLRFVDLNDAKKIRDGDAAREHRGRAREGGRRRDGRHADEDLRRPSRSRVIPAPCTT